MRRRRYYGKPPPSKKQVQAHYDFYARVDKVVQQEGKKMEIELTTPEIIVLKRLLYAEVHKYVDRMNHAASHGMDYTEADSDILVRVLCKVDPAYAES